MQTPTDGQAVTLKFTDFSVRIVMLVNIVTLYLLYFSYIILHRMLMPAGLQSVPLSMEGPSSGVEVEMHLPPQPHSQQMNLSLFASLSLGPQMVIGGLVQSFLIPHQVYQPS